MITMNVTWRTIARGIIAPIIAEMDGKSRKEMRTALRAAYPKYGAPKRGHAYKIWCEECSSALRERTRTSHKRHGVRRADDIMKSTRGWAAERGLVEVLAVLDVDGDVTASPADEKRGGGVKKTYY